MTKVISVLVCGMCWIAILFAGLLTAFWISLLAHAHTNAGAVDGFGVLGFMIYAEMVGGGSLLLVVPSGILYFVTRRRRDLLSLCLAFSSFAILACEAFVILRMPHTGAC